MIVDGDLAALESWLYPPHSYLPWFPESVREHVYLLGVVTPVGSAVSGDVRKLAGIGVKRF